MEGIPSAEQNLEEIKKSFALFLGSIKKVLKKQEEDTKKKSYLSIIPI